MSNTSDFKVKNGLSVGTSITAVGSLTTAGQTFPAADGSTGQYLKTDGSGALSWGTVSTSFNITDGTTTDTVGLTETVTFTGGTNITLAVTDNTVTINNDHVNSSDITENTNLFFTDARAIAAVQAAADLTIDGGTIYVDTSANRVGISDTSPQQTLDVAGNIGVNGTEVINASSQIVGAVLDSALTVGGSLAGVLSNLKVQYGTAYSGTPIQGSFFFDSLNQKLKVYTGSAFVDAVPAGSGGGGGGGATDANTTFRNYSYTLTGTTSAVTGADDNEITAGAFIVGHKYTITATGNTNFVTIGAANSNVNTVFTATGVGTGTGTAKQTLFYDTTSSATRVVAYVNGIKQVYGSGRDFVATTGTSVAFTYNLGSGDTVDLQVYELLTNAAYYLKTETLATTAVNSNIATAVADYLPLAGGTMTGALNIESGDNLQIKDRGSVLLYNTNDDNYGRIRNTTASGNELQFSTNALAMTIDINGKVGIGTATPECKLNVVGSSATNWADSDAMYNKDHGAFIKTYNSIETAGVESGIVMRAKATGAGVWSMYSKQTSNYLADLHFRTRNSGTTSAVRLTIKNSGNVGIGTTSPDYPLVVQSSSGGNTVKMIGRAADSISGLSFSNTGNTASNYIQGDGSFIRARADGGFHFRKGGTPVTTDTGAFTVNGLNVGIGTTNPVKFLDVGINSNAAAIDANIRLNTHYGTLNTARGGIQMHDGGNVTGQIDTRYNGSRVDMHFGSLYNGAYNSTSRMVITGAGNVGIGTSSPSALMHISGSSSSADGIHYIADNTRGAGGPAGIVMKSGHGDWKIMNSQTVGNALEFIDGGSPDATRMLINSSGVTIPQSVQPVYYEPQIKYQAVTGGFRGGSASANTWYPITNQNINGYNNNYGDGARGVNFLIKWTSGNVNRGYHHTVSGHIPVLSANSYLGYQNGSYGTSTSGTSASAGLNINISHHTGCASGHDIQCRLWGDGTDYGSIYLQIKAEAPPSGSDCQVSFWKV